ncbi:MAG: hypothetical protein RL497_458 [Pseudomonadota bacterium]
MLAIPLELDELLDELEELEELLEGRITPDELEELLLEELLELDGVVLSPLHAAKPSVNKQGNKKFN